MNREVIPSGVLVARRIPGGHPARVLTVDETVAHLRGDVGAYLPEVAEWKRRNWALMRDRVEPMLDVRRLAERAGLRFIWSQLWARVRRADGDMVNYGLVGVRVVTDVGVAAIVDAFQNTFELETFIYHGIGTGTTAEAQTDTALVTELTTQYNPDNTRATGSATEGAAANVFRTVGTNTVDAAVAITEHGIFDQAAAGGGVLLDRTVFAAINLGNGDSLETTYDFTVPAGS